MLRFKGFEKEARAKYPDIDRHDEALIAEWQSTVADGDTVYILGDLTAYQGEKIARLLERLPGHVHGSFDELNRQSGERRFDVGVDGELTRRYGVLKSLQDIYAAASKIKRPITEPHDYEHVISFYNGSIAVIISQDRPGSSNSLTLSWLLVDEAKFIDYQKLKDETLPANGGIKSYFGKHSFNHSIMILSDMGASQQDRGLLLRCYRPRLKLCRQRAGLPLGHRSRVRETRLAG